MRTVCRPRDESRCFVAVFTGDTLHRREATQCLLNPDRYDVHAPQQHDAGRIEAFDLGDHRTGHGIL